MDLIALAIGALSGTLMVLIYAISYGYQTRQARIQTPEAVNALRSMHVFMIGLFVLCLSVSVYLVEKVVKANGALWGPTWVLVMHFVVVTLFVLFLLGTLILWNGIRRRDLHWKVARITIVLFLITAVTGGYLFSLHPLIR